LSEVGWDKAPLSQAAVCLDVRTHHKRIVRVTMRVSAGFDM
jgi:hypothetical protein